MNSTSLHTPPAATASDTGVLIGLHVALPALPVLDYFLWHHTPSAFASYGINLGVTLRQAGLIAPAEVIGCHGNFRNGMIMFRTEHRNAVFKMLRDYLRATLVPSLDEHDGIFAVCEIAYKTADGGWFTAEPKGHQEPFERWFGGESETERDDLSDHAEAYLWSLITALVRARPNLPTNFRQ